MKGINKQSVLYFAVLLILLQASPGLCIPPAKKKPAVTSGSGTTTTATQDSMAAKNDSVTAKNDSVAAKNKCASLVNLDQDTPMLEGDVSKLAVRFDTLSTRLKEISQLLDIPSILAKDLKEIEGSMVIAKKGAKLAEGVPQFKPNAEKVAEAITPALAQVKSLQLQAAKLAEHLKELNLTKHNMAEMSGYSAKAAKGLNVFSADILKHEPDASFGAQVSIVHYDDPTRTCIQGKVDELAVNLDRVELEMDKVTKLLLTDYSIDSPALSGLENFAEKLVDLERERKQVERLKSSLDKMCKGLEKMEELMDKQFSVSIPYLAGSYKVHISMSTILKGSKTIEDDIKKAVSGPVWEAAKTFGIKNLVDALVKDANHDIKEVGNELHLNPDMPIPELKQLEEMETQLTQLKTVFPGDFKIPVINVNAPDFGLPHVPDGVDLRNIGIYAKQLSPYGFGWNLARLEANVPSFGCK